MATAVCNNITGPATALVSLNLDGSVGLVEGSADLVGRRTAAAMHVAEVFGVRAEDVRPSVGDTDSIGYAAISAGSSAVYKTGWGSFEAARDLQRQLAARAAFIWDVPVEKVDMAGGLFSHRSDPELGLTLKELAARQNTTGGPLLGPAGGVWAGRVLDSPCTSWTWRWTRRLARPTSSGTRPSRPPAPPSIRSTWRARCREARSRVSAGP